MHMPGVILGYEAEEDMLGYTSYNLDTELDKYSDVLFDYWQDIGNTKDYWPRVDDFVPNKSLLKIKDFKQGLERNLIAEFIKDHTCLLINGYTILEKELFLYKPNAKEIYDTQFELSQDWITYCDRYLKPLFNFDDDLVIMFFDFHR